MYLKRTGVQSPVASALTPGPSPRGRGEKIPGANMPLKVAQLGQPVLRQVAAEIPPEKIADPEFQRFLADMAQTLHEHRGVGLAAPQVFASQRVFLAAIVPPESEDGQPGI